MFLKQFGNDFMVEDSGFYYGGQHNNVKMRGIRITKYIGDKERDCKIIYLWNSNDNVTFNYLNDLTQSKVEWLYKYISNGTVVRVEQNYHICSLRKTDIDRLSENII